VLPVSRLANDSEDAAWLVIAMLSTLPADAIDVTSTLVVPAGDGPELATTAVPTAGAFWKLMLRSFQFVLETVRTS
jgi:hypothetical protein